MTTAATKTMMMRIMIRRKIGCSTISSLSSSSSAASLTAISSCFRSNNNNSPNANRFSYHTTNRSIVNSSCISSQMITTTSNGIIFQNSNKNNSINNLRGIPMTTTMMRSCPYDWNHRSFSSNDDNNDTSTISLSSPDILLPEMAIGIAKTIQFYIRYGISNRQLQQLSTVIDNGDNNHNNIVQRWQKMMEIYLTTQAHVLAGMGYEASEDGLTQFANDVMKCTTPHHHRTDDDNNDEDTNMILYDEETISTLQQLRRDTWRDLVAATFNISKSTIRELSIVEARNIMHSIASRMIEPSILQLIETRTSQLLQNNNTNDTNKDEEELSITLQRHTIIQDVIVNHVYLNNGNISKSLLEKYISLYGGNIKNDNSSQLYAKLQCSMSDHDGDPLMTQYVTSSMSKLWHIAGLTNTTSTE